MAFSVLEATRKKEVHARLTLLKGTIFSSGKYSALRPCPHRVSSPSSQLLGLPIPKMEAENSRSTVMPAYTSVNSAPTNAA